MPPTKDKVAGTNKDGKKNVKYHMPGQKNNHPTRRKTKIIDMAEQVGRRKWTWAGHISRKRDN